MTHRHAALAALILAASARPLAGQQDARLALQAGRTTDEAGVARDALSLSPSLDWSGDGVAARVAGQGSWFRDGGGLAAAAVEVRAVAASAGPLALVAGAEAAGLLSAAGHRALSTALAPELHVGGAGWGIGAGPWVGATGARAAAGRRVDTPLLPFGRGAEEPQMHWRPVTGARAAARLGDGPASARLGWSDLRSSGVRWSDVRLDAALELGRLAVGAEVGERMGAGSERWGGARAAVRLAEAVVVTGQAGRYPADPLTGRAGGRFAGVGVSVRLGGTDER